MSESLQLQLKNSGNLGATLYLFPSQYFRVDLEDESWPLKLNPQEDRVLDIYFEPPEPGRYEDRIGVLSEEDCRTHWIELFGKMD